MRKLSNPWIWLRRLRQRRGYGVHSPFAFRFLTEVVYEQGAFYDFDVLDRQLRPLQRLRIRRLLHMLFRLSNFVQPERIYVPAEASLEASYLQAGCKHATLSPVETPDCNAATLYFVRQPSEVSAETLGPRSVLVLDRLQSHKAWFRSLPATVFFDLHDIGVAIFDNAYNRQYYTINFE